MKIIELTLAFTDLHLTNFGVTGQVTRGSLVHYLEFSCLQTKSVVCGMSVRRSVQEVNS